MRDKTATEAERSPYVSVSDVCPGCARIEEERHNVQQQDSPAHGTRVFLVPYEEFHGNPERWQPDSEPSAAATADASGVDAERNEVG